MTGPSAYGEEPIDRWLADRHHDLHDGLGRFLGPGVGLREAMLHAEHDGLLGALDCRLNIEAGLTAILQPSPDPPQLEPSLPDVAAAIAAADPAARMALRRDPVVLAAILSDLLVWTLMIADNLARNLAIGFDRTSVGDLYRALVFGLARVLGRDLARIRVGDLDVGGSFSSDWARASDVDAARARIREISRNLNDDDARDFVSAGVRALARDLARALAREIDDTLARDLNDADVRALVHALAFKRVGDPAFDRVADPDAVARDLARARDLAHRVALVVGRRLGIWHVEGLAAALLDGALDDFTRADLSHADLTDLDLTGVRWSAADTRWPPGTDIDALRARSREVAPGTGIYAIGSPGDGPKTNVLV